ncbi:MULTISPECIES: type IV pilus secretin PilQ [unclassified Corallococcus]|uniref:type IV pilus secretin PilQ n=1 Tax=unclassified Corallococcus TaxID=2685029 RepID=UPI001A8EF4F7|nr:MULTISPECIES: type IV pilus secretin PilQ [unclassified Corallococcus]MBN9683162.1 type IV pilus secretin PilQ [Corallococcus sp. NCSPR001]WAS85311.1 type IV pilus secretin PilQ [Corallococcus sp. NCRR]
MLEQSAVTRGKWIMAAAWAVVLASAKVYGADLNTLRDLQVSRTGAGAQVVVTGTRPPTFTVFRLSGPERLVVDLSSADATGIKGHHDGTGPVSGVVAAQFSDARASVGRVLVALDQASQYDVRAEGNRVVISVDGSPVAPAAATAQAQAEAKPAPVKAEPAPAVAAAPVKAAPAPVVEAMVAVVPEEGTSSKAAPSQAPGRENVVATEADEREVAHPAQRITRLSLDGESLRVAADGDIARFEVLELVDPPRLAVDVYGVGLSAKAPKVKGNLLKDVRVGAHEDKVRLVLVAKGDMPAYRVDRAERGLEVVLGGAVARKSKPAQPRDAVAETEPLRPHPLPVQETAKPQPAVAQAASQPAVVEVKDLSFDESPSGGRVQLKLSGATAWKVDRPDPRSAVLTLENARLPKKLERSLDTSALDTPVKMISAFSVPGEGRKVRLVVAADGAIEENVTQGANSLSWRLDVQGVKTEEVAVAQRTAGFTAEAPAYAAEGAPQQARYRGKRVSFEFKDIDIQNLLRVIAEISKRNIVVADDVSGRVTIRLRNVPWDQALDLILRTKQLGQEQVGNIIRIAPLKTLEEEARLRQERKKSLQQQEDLLVSLVPVNYAVAGDMSARVKDVLSDRGTVTVDTRTNVLIIKDIRSNTEKARALVRSLDTQTPQVLIESRIVEASTTFSRDLGVQWGGQTRLSAASGNPTGLIFPSTVGVTGGIAGTAAGVPAQPNFAVNLPAAVGEGLGGAMGFAFGSAGGAVQLNLRLSAAETEGTVKTISSPKVTTLDNNTARISQGLSIPFSQTSAGGVNTTFVEARLSLEVTPHITQDGSILMSIQAQNNQPDPSNTGANGQPSIQRKEANTQVLVKDGETTVIGGIYVRRGSTRTDSVPFLAKIPVLGFFFKTTFETDDRQELLIFITPRILNRQTIAQSL